MRKPSDATQVRQLKSELRRAKAELAQANSAVHIYRGRATKAESEAADWRRRFDLLLARSADQSTEVHK